MAHAGVRPWRCAACAYASVTRAKVARHARQRHATLDAATAVVYVAGATFDVNTGKYRRRAAVAGQGGGEEGRGGGDEERGGGDEGRGGGDEERGGGEEGRGGVEEGRGGGDEGRGGVEEGRGGGEEGRGRGEEGRGGGDKGTGKDTGDAWTCVVTDEATGDAVTLVECVDGGDVTRVDVSSDVTVVKTE